MLKFLLILVLVQFKFSYAPEANLNQNEAMEIQFKKSPAKYACPAESEPIIKKLQKLAKNHYESGYCLFEKRFEPGQKKVCKFELKPVFAKRTDENLKPIRCGSGRNKFLYYFGYYFCGGKNELDEIEKIKKSRDNKKFIGSLKSNHVPQYVYDVCYDISTEKTIWTSHSVQEPSSLLSLRRLLEEESYQASDEISTDSFFINSKRFLKIKHQYEIELEKPHTEQDLYMLPRPLVPSSHFFTDLWKKTTNHYINMAPLLKKREIMMTAINDGIKTASLNVLKFREQKLLIYTAVKGIHKPGLLSRILNYDSFETFKGNIWCKFVYNEISKEGVMIYIHNTLEKHVKRKCPEEKVIQCDFVSWATSITSGEARFGIDLLYAYCCEVSSEETQEIFSKDFEIGSVLRIDELISNTY